LGPFVHVFKAEGSGVAFILSGYIWVWYCLWHSWKQQTRASIS